jgi:hypothetical protein
VGLRQAGVRLRRLQRIVATAADSVLRTEMSDLETQGDNAIWPVLWYHPKSWLGVLRLTGGTLRTRAPRRLVTAVEQLADLFHTTTTVLKTQQVARSRGMRCGDIELAVYLADAAGPINLVLDMCIAHERWMRSSSPVLHGNLPYPAPTDIDKPLNEAAADKIRD